VGAGAYFYDINAKVSHTFENQNDKLSASFYCGDDALYMNLSYREKDTQEIIKENMGLRMSWGNLMTAVNWEHRFGPRLFSNTQLSYTRYRYKLKEQMKEQIITAPVLHLRE